MSVITKPMRLTAELAARCHRHVDEPKGGTGSYDYFTDDDYPPVVERLLAEAPRGGFWIFAYGSLIWKPEVPVAERRVAVAEGWHRAFSLRIEHFRATPDQPGYMMCLDRGGRCEGVVQRLPDEGLAQHLHKLLFREIGSHEALEGTRWVEVSTAMGPVLALTFYAAPTRLSHYASGRPLAEVAHALARACGHWGSGAEYLRSTVAHLMELGIHDENLWALQEMVADEIGRMRT